MSDRIALSTQSARPGMKLRGVRRTARTRSVSEHRIGSVRRPTSEENNPHEWTRQAHVERLLLCRSLRSINRRHKPFLRVRLPPIRRCVETKVRKRTSARSEILANARFPRLLTVCSYTSSRLFRSSRLSKNSINADT